MTYELLMNLAAGFGMLMSAISVWSYHSARRRANREAKQGVNDRKAAIDQVAVPEGSDYCLNGDHVVLRKQMWLNPAGMWICTTCSPKPEMPKGLRNPPPGRPRSGGDGTRVFNFSTLAAARAELEHRGGAGSIMIVRDNDGNLTGYRVVVPPKGNAGVIVSGYGLADKVGRTQFDHHKRGPMAIGSPDGADGFGSPGSWALFASKGEAYEFSKGCQPSFVRQEGPYWRVNVGMLHEPDNGSLIVPGSLADQAIAKAAGIPPHTMASRLQQLITLAASSYDDQSMPMPAIIVQPPSAARDEKMTS